MTLQITTLLHRTGSNFVSAKESMHCIAMFVRLLILTAEISFLHVSLSLCAFTMSAQIALDNRILARCNFAMSGAS